MQKKILLQLGADERTIDLAMLGALLHDIGLSKGDKENHAIESGNLFEKYIQNTDITKEEKEILRQAIVDHSNGNNIQSLIGLSLVLADKLDITYHRTEHSSIQDKINKEIQKIKKVDIKITDTELIVIYNTDTDFDISILNNWKKPITIPKKVAEYLGKNFILIVNNIEIDYKAIFNLV